MGTKSPQLLKPHPSSLSSLTYSQPTQIHLRDGEVVLYRRHDSPLWQCRFKLQDGTWHRQSTKRASIEHAVAIATELYDEARFRQRLGLAHETRTFAQIATATLDELRRQLDAGTGKSVYSSYITCIERYFLPYFADCRLEELTHQHIEQFLVSLEQASTHRRQSRMDKREGRHSQIVNTRTKEQATSSIHTNRNNPVV